MSKTNINSNPFGGYYGYDEEKVADIIADGLIKNKGKNFDINSLKPSMDLSLTPNPTTNNVKYTGTYSNPNTSAQGSSYSYQLNPEGVAARAWQEYMSNTSHQREVQDLIAAGLNPVLSANNGASAYSASSGSQNTELAEKQLAANLEIAKLQVAAQLQQTSMNNTTALKQTEMSNSSDQLIAALNRSVTTKGYDNKTLNQIIGSLGLLLMRK